MEFWEILSYCTLGELKVVKQVWHEGDLLQTGCDVVSLDGEDENNTIQWRNPFQCHILSDKIFKGDLPQIGDRRLPFQVSDFWVQKEPRDILLRNW